MSELLKKGFSFSFFELCGYSESTALVFSFHDSFLLMHSDRILEASVLHCFVFYFITFVSVWRLVYCIVLFFILQHLFLF